MAHIIIYFMALLSLSTSPTWAKLNQMPPEVLGFWRLSMAALLLFGYLTFKNRLKNPFKMPVGSSKSTPTQLGPYIINRNVFWILISGFFFFLHLWTYKYASKNTLVSNTMILFATNPIFASIGSLLFLKEKFKPRVGVAYVLALSGLALFLYRTLNFAPEQKWGNWSAVISALFYAVYMITGKKAREDFENIDYAFLQYLTCAICFAITSLFTGGVFFEGYTAISWYSVIALVLIPTLIGHLGLTYLVKFMDLSVLSCGKLVEPILASIIAYFVFNEVVMDGAGLAFAMTAAGVFILFWPQIKSAQFQK